MCFEGKTGVILAKFYWEPFQVVQNCKILVYFSKILENTRPNVALMIKFVEFLAKFC